MPTAPTISIVEPKGLYLRVAFTNSGSGDHNQLWRMTPSEYGGLFIKIADPIPWSTSSAQFRDYAVASGKTYTYYMVAVDSAGVETTGNSLSSSEVLDVSVIHPHNKFYKTSATLSANADNLTRVPISDFAPYQLNRKLNTQTRIIAGATRPRIGVGNVRHTQAAPSFIIPYDQDNRATLRVIFESDYYACLRTAFGEKYFGRLGPVSEDYGPTFTTPGMLFEVLSFSEEVA